MHTTKVVHSEGICVGTCLRSCTLGATTSATNVTPKVTSRCALPHVTMQPQVQTLRSCVSYWYSLWGYACAVGVLRYVGGMVVYRYSYVVAITPSIPPAALHHLRDDVQLRWHAIGGHLLHDIVPLQLSI